MISNIAKFEIKIGERAYQLLCDQQSPLGELYDVLSQMKGHVVNKMKELDSPAPNPES